MYAVIETGGKQYQVKANDTLFIEKLNVEAEENIVFDKVIAVGGEDGLMSTVLLSVPKSSRTARQRRLRL